jgi:bis(5'-nucleosyl)-tetraphosphatase (symmetrical)
MPRRIFIGDVQGCRVELEQLLARLRFDPAADALFSVGDLVNRGPDSLGALRLARTLGARAVLGNHDVHLLQRAAGLRAAKSGDTLEDVLAAPDRDELLAWLAAQPFVRQLDDVWLVHAALHPRWRDPVRELAGADPLRPTPAAVFALRTRYCDRDGNVPERDDVEPPPPFRPWHEHYRASEHGGRTVVFGHWAAQGLFLRPHLRGLDSGCVWGKALTAWIPGEDRIVSVPAARAYARIDSTA